MLNLSRVNGWWGPEIFYFLDRSYWSTYGDDPLGRDELKMQPVKGKI